MKVFSIQVRDDRFILTDASDEVGDEWVDVDMAMPDAWKLSFYLKDELVDEIEGWTNEDPWRYAQIYKIIKFTERYIPKDMGAQYMITEE